MYSSVSNRPHLLTWGNSRVQKRDIPAGRRVERLFGNQAQTDGGLRYTAKRGALHSGVQDRQGAEGGDRRHERRDGACAVRLYLYARNGCERPETVCGYPSSRYAVATVRLATA